MGVFGSIGHVLGKVGGAIAFVVGIGKQLVPFIVAAREVSPDIDAALAGLEAQVTAAGTAADDWLDARLAAIEALDGFFHELVAAGTAGVDVTQTALAISQGAESPDIVTPAESELLLAKVAILRHALTELGRRQDIEAVLAAI